MRLLTTQGGLPRVSWGAVIAGVILSLIVYLIFSVLGTAIGASLLSPMSRPNPLQGFGFGSGVWVIVTTVIAVFIGSYFAGRCAPVLGWLHGLLAWAVMVLLVAYGMTSIIGGAVSVASTSASIGAASSPSGTSGTAGSSMMPQALTGLASTASGASNPQAEQDARQTADTAARAIARATWFSFAALVVGAVIAIGSGNLGFSHQPPFEEGGGSGRDDVAPVKGTERGAGTSRPVR